MVPLKRPEFQGVATPHLAELGKIPPIPAGPEPGGTGNTQLRKGMPNTQALPGQSGSYGARQAGLPMVSGPSGTAEMVPAKSASAKSLRSLAQTNGNPKKSPSSASTPSQLDRKTSVPSFIPPKKPGAGGPMGFAATGMQQTFGGPPKLGGGATGFQPVGGNTGHAGAGPLGGLPKPPPAYGSTIGQPNKHNMGQGGSGGNPALFNPPPGVGGGQGSGVNPGAGGGVPGNPGGIPPWKPLNTGGGNGGTRPPMGGGPPGGGLNGGGGAGAGGSGGNTAQTQIGKVMQQMAQKNWGAAQPGIQQTNRMGSSAFNTMTGGGYTPGGFGSAMGGGTPILPGFGGAGQGQGMGGGGGVEIGGQNGHVPGLGGGRGGRENLGFVGGGGIVNTPKPAPASPAAGRPSTPSPWNVNPNSELGGLVGLGGMGTKNPQAPPPSPAIQSGAGITKTGSGLSAVPPGTQYGSRIGPTMDGSALDEPPDIDDIAGGIASGSGGDESNQPTGDQPRRDDTGKGSGGQQGGAPGGTGTIVTGTQGAPPGVGGSGASGTSGVTTTQNGGSGGQTQGGNPAGGRPGGNNPGGAPPSPGGTPPGVTGPPAQPPAAPPVIEPPIVPTSGDGRQPPAVPPQTTNPPPSTAGGGIGAGGSIQQGGGTYEQPKSVGSQGWSEGGSQNQSANQGTSTSQGTSSGTSQSTGSSTATGQSTSTGRGGSSHDQTWDINKVKDILGPLLARENAPINPYTKADFEQEANRGSAQIAASANNQMRNLMARAGSQGFDPNSAAVLLGARGILQNRGLSELQNRNALDSQFRQKFGDFEMNRLAQDVIQRGQDKDRTGMDADLAKTLLGQTTTFNNQDSQSTNASNSVNQSTSQNQAQNTSDAQNSGWSNGTSFNRSEWWPILTW